MFYLAELRTRLRRVVAGLDADVLEWIPRVIDPNGLCATWPGGHGRVSLTAWTVEFLAAAKKAGHGIDTPGFVRPERAMYQIGG